MERSVCYMLVKRLAFGVQPCLRAGQIVYPSDFSVADSVTNSR